MSPFQQYASTLLNNGMSPIPIIPNQKRPLGVCAFYEHWNELRERPLLPRQIDILCRSNPYLGLGVAGGFNCLVPVDIDTDDPDIKRAAFKALPPAKVVKQGKKGGTIFYWNSDGMIEAQKFKRPRGTGWDFLAEILVTGQSVLPHTIHPETMKPYRWLTSATLFNTKVDDLPEIRQEHIAALAEALKPWLERPESITLARECKPGIGINAQMLSYAQGALNGEFQRLSSLSEGRNLGLFYAALRLGKFVKAQVLSQSEVERKLMDATNRNGYAQAKHGGKIRAIKSLRSGLKTCHSSNLPDLRREHAQEVNQRTHPSG